MAREFIRLCKLTEEPERDQKRSRCRRCTRSGFFSLFSYDPSRPKKEEVSGE